MGRLAGLLGAGVGLAVEISKSNNRSPASEQAHELPSQEPRDSSPASDRIASRPRRRGSLPRSFDPDYDARGESNSPKPTLRKSLRQSQHLERQNGSHYRSNRTQEKNANEYCDADQTYLKSHRRGDLQYETNDEPIYPPYEPPSYATATGSTDSALHPSPSSQRRSNERRLNSEDYSLHKSVYGSGSKSDTSRNPTLGSISPVGLPLPVIVPQRRPEDKSRGWMLCYAPMLEACDISEPEFLAFLTSFNEASKVDRPLFSAWF